MPEGQVRWWNTARKGWIPQSDHNYVLLVVKRLSPAAFGNTTMASTPASFTGLASLLTKNLLALDISASGDANSSKWFVVSTLLSRSTEHLVKSIVPSSVYIQLEYVLAILFSVWLTPTGTPLCKRHVVYYSSVNKVLQWKTNLFSGGEKKQPKQVHQDLPAPTATGVCFTAQLIAEASPYKSCAGSCTPLAASQTVAFSLLHHIFHSAILETTFLWNPNISFYEIITCMVRNFILGQ